MQEAKMAERSKTTAWSGFLVMWQREAKQLPGVVSLLCVLALTDKRSAPLPVIVVIKTLSITSN
jgi:hypothetical protein